MVNEDTAIAISETLEVLSHMDESDISAIPIDFLEFLQQNKSKNYESKIDYSINISNINLKQKTDALLALICMKYWSNEEQRKELEKSFKNNEIEYQEKLKEKYNVENIFERNNKIEDKIEIDSTKELVIYKEILWIRIIKKIKNIIKRK